MDAIFIPRLLKAPQQQETIKIDDNLEDLETLTPVRGDMLVSHRGDYLEVIAKAAAIVTMACDRCLQNYNARLKIEKTELIWLQPPVDPSTLPNEREVFLDDLEESLDPHGYFDPETWLYEQFCLEMPLRKVCDPDRCLGIDIEETKQEKLIDSRWSQLAALKTQLSP